MSQTLHARVERADIGSASVALTVIDCPTCFVIFAMPARMVEERRGDGAKFYCPSGHWMSYTESELDKAKKRAERLAREKEQAEADRSWYQDQLRKERESHKTTERKLNGTKGALKKAQKRAAAALCPVQGCGRSFVQMSRHLSAKHPGWADNHDADA